MKPLYSTLLVANGADLLDVLSEVMTHRDYGEYIYHPGGNVSGVSLPTHSLSDINGEWLHKWHKENPEYEFRSVYHRPFSNISPDRFSDRPAIAMPSPDSIAPNHHIINADLVHVPTHKKVGDDMLISLAQWPALDSGKHEGPRSHATTAHIFSFYRHNQPAPGEHDPHHGIMTKVLDSWLGHAKSHGVHHGFIQGDASKGYWLKNITRHPDMVWGGVEYSNESGRTRYPQEMDRRRIGTLKSNPKLFAGWPIKKTESDAFTMRWNQDHPKPEGSWGPIPTHIMRFEHGSAKKYDGTLDQACYHHALRNAKRKGSNLKLAVGFAARADEADAYERNQGPVPLMFTHAFNILPDGTVHDTTWGSEATHRFRYYGHVVDDPRQFKNGEHLSNWFGHHFQTGHDRGPSAIHMGIQHPPDHNLPVRTAKEQVTSYD